MDTRYISDSYKRTLRYICQREIKPAIDELLFLLEDIQDGQLIDRIKQQDTTYRYMLQYLSEGKEDPEQKNIFAKLQLSLYEIADDCYESLMMKYSSKLYFVRKKEMMAKQQITSCEKLLNKYNRVIDERDLHASLNEAPSQVREIQKDAESILSMLFYRVWLFGVGIEREALLAEIGNVHYTAAYEMMIQAITLRLVQRFDECDIHFLISAYERTTDTLRWKALVGILLVVYFQEERWLCYPALVSRLLLLNENPSFLRELTIAIIQMIRTSETEEISKKLNEEILPQIMKMNPELQKRMNLNDLMNDVSGMEVNPEWDELIMKMNNNEQIHEINDLQMEGADVLMNTFASMKNFSFFSEMSNWFVPFDSHNSFLQLFSEKTENRLDKFIQYLQNHFFVCNSDKYSLCLEIIQMAPTNREMIMSSIEMVGDEMDQLGNADELVKIYRNGEILCKQYVQDLYRFYKLYPQRSDFTNILTCSLSLHKSSLIQQLLLGTSYLDQIASFYFKKKYYGARLEVFNLQIKTTLNDAKLYQQAGFCLQKQARWEEALKYYLRADLIEENNLWTLRQIASCYRQLKNFAKSLDYLKRIEVENSEDISILINKGNCYLELNEIDAALKCYFKVDYFNPSIKVWRPIAWCCFLTKKYPESARYYQKIMNDSPTEQDFLNAGHNAWCSGNRSEAFRLYQLGFLLKKKNSFFDLFRQDISILTERGISADDVCFMEDQLRYSVI